MRETFYSYAGGAWSTSWWLDQAFFLWEGGGSYAGAGLRTVDLEVTSTRTLLECEKESSVKTTSSADDIVCSVLGE